MTILDQAIKSAAEQFAHVFVETVRRELLSKASIEAFRAAMAGAPMPAPGGGSTSRDFFFKGDRVRLSASGIRRLRKSHGACADFRGTVVSVNKNGPRVRWDGEKVSSEVVPSGLELIDEVDAVLDGFTEQAPDGAEFLPPEPVAEVAPQPEPKSEPVCQPAEPTCAVEAAPPQPGPATVVPPSPSSAGKEDSVAPVGGVLRGSPTTTSLQGSDGSKIPAPLKRVRLSEEGLKTLFLGAKGREEKTGTVVIDVPGRSTVKVAWDGSPPMTVHRDFVEPAEGRESNEGTISEGPEGRRGGDGSDQHAVDPRTATRVRGDDDRGTGLGGRADHEAGGEHRLPERSVVLGGSSPSELTPERSEPTARIVSADRVKAWGLGKSDAPEAVAPVPKPAAPALKPSPAAKALASVQRARVPTPAPEAPRPRTGAPRVVDITTPGARPPRVNGGSALLPATVHFKPDPPAEKRGVTLLPAEFYGDPPKDRSALDQRRAEEAARAAKGGRI